MGNYNLYVPVKTLESVGGATRQTTLANIKSLYGSTIKNVAMNSNVPEEALYSLMYVISNGLNNTAYKTPDKLVRQGVFGLSQKTAKQILAYEMAFKRMSQAEKDYLSSLDPAIKSYLGEKGTKGFNEHWESDFKAGLDRVSDTLKPFNLMDPRVSSQIAAIWFGQVWDKYSEQTNKPFDKVLVTMLLPYDGWMSGNSFAKAKPWTYDYSGEQFKTLPGAISSDSSYSIIAPPSVTVAKSVSPDIKWALREIMAQGGTMDILTR